MRIKVLWYPKELYNNIIPFISLMLITEDIEIRRRILKLVIGVSVLVGYHILLSVVVGLFYNDYQIPPSALYYKLKVPFYLFSQTLPFLLWAILAKKNLLNLFMPKKVLAVSE